jgi:hypothetical protein
MLCCKRNVMTILALGALAVSAGAQSRRPDVRRAQEASRQDVKRAEEKPASPVRLVERAPAEYLSGEANVAVSGNQNPVIKLGLSPNGATIIEFPASDKLFNIIPGNSNLVTVEESPTKDTDRFVIVRPGDGFTSPTTQAQMRRAPASSVIVQMTSGMVVTFLFYPVPQLAEQAHRVVVTYDRNEVIASRRAAGLAVNLDNSGDNKPRSTTSLRVTSPISVAGAVEAEAPRPLEKADQAKADWDAVAGTALTEAIRSSDRFNKWSDTEHDLSIAALPAREVNRNSQVVAIAVRNTGKSAARLVSDQPEIYVETLNEKRKLLTVDPVRKLAIQSTAIDGLIPGGGTAYYAIVYETPILGARQRLRIAAGQTTAADEPAKLTLNKDVARR